MESFVSTLAAGLSNGRGKGRETMFSNLVGECNDAIECVLSRGVIEGMAALYLSTLSASVTSHANVT